MVSLLPSGPAVLYVRGGMGPRGGHDVLEKKKVILPEMPVPNTISGLQNKNASKEVL